MGETGPGGEQRLVLLISDRLIGVRVRGEQTSVLYLVLSIGHYDVG